MIIPVFRSPHSPEFTARGVANGVFWAFTPTIGLQTAEILATWFVGKRILHKDSSLVQAMVWVWINNPLTMVPMYYTFYVTGSYVTTNAWFATAVGCAPYAIGGAAVSYHWTLRVVGRRQARLQKRRAVRVDQVV